MARMEPERQAAEDDLTWTTDSGEPAPVATEMTAAPGPIPPVADAAVATTAAPAASASDQAFGPAAADPVASGAATIRRKRDDAIAHRDIIAAGLRDLDRDLEAAEAAGDADKVASLTETRGKLETWETELDTSIGAADKDLALIEAPGTSRAEIHRALARHQTGGSAVRGVEALRDDAAYRKAIGAGRSLVRGGWSETTEASALVGGAAVSETATEARTRGLAGYGTSASRTTEIVAGDDVASSTTKKRAHVSLHEGLALEESTSESETSGGVTSSSSATSSKQVGLGGMTDTTTRSTKVDDYEMKDKQSTSWNRGDGKIGRTTSRTRSEGTVDDDGNLVKGSALTTTTEAHVQADKDKVGIGGSASAKGERAYSENVKVGATSACDGHVTVSVKPYELKSADGASSEPRFLVEISAQLGASLGASGTLGKASGTSAGASGGVKGSATVAFRHVLSAAECKAYLADLGTVSPGNAGNGRYPEFAQIAAAWRSGWSGDGLSAAGDAAKIATLDTPEAIRDMADGDAIEYSVTGGVDGKAELGASSGGLSAGVEGGVSKSGTLKFLLAKVGDKLHITVSVAGETGWSAGGSLGYGGAKATYGHAESETSGRSVTFKLAPEDAKWKAEIQAARTTADLERLIAAHPDLLKEHERSSSETASDTVGVSVGGAGFEMGGSGTVGTTTTVDDEGKQTRTDTGSSTASGKLELGSLGTIGDAKTEAVETTVDADGQASGDLSLTESGTSMEKTMLAADDRIRQSGAVAVATGSAFKPVDATEQAGMFLSDADYDQLIAIASNDPKEWNRHWSSTRHEADWKALRAEIARAGGDKKKVGAALAKFLGDGDHGRQELVAAVVRKPLGDGQGGVMYAFPDGLGGLKASYKSLVFDDPGRKAAELAKSGKPGEATAEAQRQLDALDSLYAQLMTAQNDFAESGKIAAFGEMLSRITQRKRELGAYLAGGEAERDRRRYNDLITNCSNYKDQETKAYDRLVELDGHDAVEQVRIENELRALYLRWDPEYKEMAELGGMWGFNKNLWTKYKPDHYRWKQSHDGEKPVGKSIDEQFDDERREKDAEALNESIMERSVARAEAKAHAQQKQYATARDQAAARQRAAIAAAKQKAALAAAWHNRATRDQAAIAPAAAQKAGDGWSRWAKANAEEKQFNFVAGNALAMEAGVNAAAQKAIDLFHEAETMFTEGKALNH